ncbi:MAG TPA: hypothetical protein VF147_14590 [Vicinamibacterales bacterium]
MTRFSAGRSTGYVGRPFRVAITVSIAIAALFVPTLANAQQRYALIVSGATGGAEYVDQYAKWTAQLSEALTGRMKIDAAHVTVLSETTTADRIANAANVRRILTTVRQSMSRDDLLFIVLIGHGTFDGVDAKFNLVGPDLESAEWAALLKPLAGRVVLVNTSSGSFPFLERLSGPRRIVITATDSAAQRFDTVFPEYFVAAFEDEAADIDKNGRISIWEAFAAASAGVRRHYQQRGQLTTERALIDDNGDGVGNEAVKPQEDGSAASRTYLDEPLPGAAPTDEALLKLLQKKATLEAEVDDLKIRRQFLPAEDYAKEFERIMIELARVSHDIRERGRT